MKFVHPYIVISVHSYDSIYISFVIFEKAKAIECKDYINLLITGHLSDTNVREQNMKLMDNADKNTEKIIDALKK